MTTYKAAESAWAKEKVIAYADVEGFVCEHPEILTVRFEDGEGSVQIGDYTWDYDEDSVTITYLDDKKVKRELYFTQKFSQILGELVNR